jgi:hypothetical protein
MGICVDAGDPEQDGLMQDFGRRLRAGFGDPLAGIPQDWIVMLDRLDGAVLEKTGTKTDLQHPDASDQGLVRRS